MQLFLLRQKSAIYRQSTDFTHLCLLHGTPFYGIINIFHGVKEKWLFIFGLLKLILAAGYKEQEQRA